MYASLIAAGVSRLTDLYNSVSGSSTTSTSSFDPSTSASATSSTVSGGTSSNFSSDLHKLFVDLQAGTSPTTASATDPTSTVASDLQSLSKDAKVSGHHGHHHGSGPSAGSLPGDDTQTDTSDGSSASTLTSSPAAANKANPFQALASSLLAYAKTQSQSVNATASTSFTA